jgi:hypothetical protein
LELKVKETPAGRDDAVMLVMETSVKAKYVRARYELLVVLEEMGTPT